jgi:hypothetical protein
MYTYAKRAIVGMNIIATTTLNSSLSAVSQSPFGIVLAPRPPDANRGLPARNAWDTINAPKLCTVASYIKLRSLLVLEIFNSNNALKTSGSTVITSQRRNENATEY